MRGNRDREKDRIEEMILFCRIACFSWELSRAPPLNEARRFDCATDRHKHRVLTLTKCAREGLDSFRRPFVSRGETGPRGVLTVIMRAAFAFRSQQHRADVSRVWGSASSGESPHRRHG